MTDLATGLGQQKKADQTEVVTAAAPALITEQEVLFGTAAAVAVPSAKRNRPRDVRRHYPKRYSYLEDSLMSREMDRL
ncbi:MAG: hypothetical protein ACRDU5_20615 [Mycobacterium sp.]